MNVLLDKTIPEKLIPWFHKNKRDLPWRKDHDPYHIWISEIMLQQTRVEAVKGYYARFLKDLPSIRDLATCSDDKLNKLWEGLGYYSRVRNLKKAAICIEEMHGGIFPTLYEDILSLPGIGAYTAGAISSIAYNEKKAAVDGNVLRVVSRLRNDTTPIDSPVFKKEVQTALELIYPDEAGDFTQALMELGATLCGPNKKPDCNNCPCKDICEGFNAGTAELLPIKSPKKEKRTEEVTLWILRCGDRYAITKRDKTGLLADLWQFPNVKEKLELQSAISHLSYYGLEVSDVRMQLDKTHVFTHIIWRMRGYYFSVKNENDAFVWKKKDEICTGIPLPTAFRQFWDEIV